MMMMMIQEYTGTKHFVLLLLGANSVPVLGQKPSHHMIICQTAIDNLSYKNETHYTFMPITLFIYLYFNESN